MKFLFVLAACAALQAQPKQFDVSTVKPNSTNDHRFSIQVQPGGRFTATGATLRMLMTMAYGVRDFQISGGPSWISSDAFDIQAKAEGVADRIPQEQMRPMLQALLEERFQLKIRRETKEMPIYALMVAKNGPKLEPSTGAAGGPGSGPGLRMGRGQLKGTKVSMTFLCSQLGQQLGRVVVDKTGLTGDYDFTLEWTPEPGEGGQMMMGPPGGRGPDAPAPPPANGPTLFTALQEQLGLRVESQKGPVEILVIDSVQKPTEN